MRCYFCKKPITVKSGNKGPEPYVLHHIDGNHGNDDPSNHADAHRGCHAAHHARLQHLGKPLPERTKAKISASLKGRAKTDEHKRRIGDTLRKGKPPKERISRREAGLRRRARMKDRPVKDLAEHGVNGYKNHGCRCEQCTDEHSAHHRQYMAQRRVAENRIMDS